MCAEVDEKKYKGDVKKKKKKTVETQPGRCMKTESRRGDEEN